MNFNNIIDEISDYINVVFNISIFINKDSRFVDLILI